MKQVIFDSAEDEDEFNKFETILEENIRKKSNLRMNNNVSGFTNSTKQSIEQILDNFNQIKLNEKPPTLPPHFKEKKVYLDLYC